MSYTDLTIKGDLFVYDEGHSLIAVPELNLVINRWELSDPEFGL